MTEAIIEFHNNAFLMCVSVPSSHHICAKSLILCRVILYEAQKPGWGTVWMLFNSFFN